MAGHRGERALPVASSRPWADRARGMLAEPNTIAGILPAMATVAVLLVLPARDWSMPELAVLCSAAIAGVFFAVLWLVVAKRRQIPPWTRHVNIGIGNVLVTAVIVVTSSERLNMANLYLLTATFAVLLFSVRAALAHVAVAGVCYAAVLAYGPSTREAPLNAWLSVFGSITVMAAVVLGLVATLRLAATVDPLTGLANRRAWDERADDEMERSRRTGTALTVVLVDLDGFKDVNDRDGHAAGDRLLQTIAKAWQTQVREGGDFLARIGGDEFAVLAPGTDHVEIRRLIRRFEEITPTGVTFSAGEATWDGVERAPDLLRRADLAMYEAKKLKRSGDPHPHTA